MGWTGGGGGRGGRRSEMGLGGGGEEGRGLALQVLISVQIPFHNKAATRWLCPIAISKSLISDEIVTTIPKQTKTKK